MPRTRDSSPFLLFWIPTRTIILLTWTFRWNLCRPVISSITFLAFRIVNCRLSRTFLSMLSAVWRLFQDGWGLYVCYLLPRGFDGTESETQGAGKHPGNKVSPNILRTAIITEEKGELLSSKVDSSFTCKRVASLNIKEYVDSHGNQRTCQLYSTLSSRFSIEAGYS